MQDIFENNVYKLVVKNLTRTPGNFREECERRAVELYRKHKKIVVSLSGGLDSQMVLRSFTSQNIPVEVVFLHLKGVNDIERNMIKELEKKYNFFAEVVEFDIDSIKDQLIHQANLYGVSRSDILHKLFLEKLSCTGLFVYHANDIRTYRVNLRGPDMFFRGWNLSGVTRKRILSLVSGPDNVCNFTSTEAIMYSSLTDPIYKAASLSSLYFGKSFFEENTIWTTIVKPLIYSNYWKDDLIYYEKYDASQNSDILTYETNHNNALCVPLSDFLHYIGPTNGTPKETTLVQNYNPERQ